MWVAGAHGVRYHPAGCVSAGPGAGLTSTP